MRTTLFFICLIIAFTSCTKRDDVNLSITTSQWYLTRDIYGGGEVNLKILGSTNGDKVMILTSGDGVVSWQKVELDSEKNFNTDIVIGFSHAVPNGEFEMSTKVMAYKDRDSLMITLNSGKLKY
jgi:hypothetical protein